MCNFQFFLSVWQTSWVDNFHIVRDELYWQKPCMMIVRTKGVSQFYHLSFDDNKVLKLSIGYAKSLFKCTGP